MRVIFTTEAEEDLYAIGHYIVENNPSRALTFLAEIAQACQDLETSYYAYPLLPHRPAAGIRRRPHGNYLIFYRIRDVNVEILHIVHGARDYERILFPDS